MIIESIGDLAPTAALLMFAIMFFGIMIDVGLFDPLIRFITRFLGNDPAKVVLGTAILAGAVSLDGDGSTTFIITTSAMLPIYLRLGMSPVVLTCVAGLMNGTLNIVPWGGPTVRAASALGVSPTDIFVPMLPSLATGLVDRARLRVDPGTRRAQAHRLARVLAGERRDGCRSRGQPRSGAASSAATASCAAPRSSRARHATLSTTGSGHRAPGQRMPRARRPSPSRRCSKPKTSTP